MFAARNPNQPRRRVVHSAYGAINLSFATPLVLVWLLRKRRDVPTTAKSFLAGPWLWASRCCGSYTPHKRSERPFCGGWRSLPHRACAPCQKVPLCDWSHDLKNVVQSSVSASRMDRLSRSETGTCCLYGPGKLHSISLKQRWL